MLEIIKETGIFIVIAQALLYFVPGESYVKYVKVVIAIILIAQLASPLLSLSAEVKFDNILKEGMSFFEQIDMDVAETGNIVYSEIYLQIGEEIKEKLSGSSLEGYTAKSVKVRMEDEEIKLEIIVVKEAGNTLPNKSLSELSACYGELLGMESDDIVVKTK